MHLFRSTHLLLARIEEDVLSKLRASGEGNPSSVCPDTDMVRVFFQATLDRLHWWQGTLQYHRRVSRE